MYSSPAGSKNCVRRYFRPLLSSTPEPQNRCMKGRPSSKGRIPMGGTGKLTCLVRGIVHFPAPPDLYFAPNVINYTHVCGDRGAATLYLSCKPYSVPLTRLFALRVYIPSSSTAPENVIVCQC